MKKKIYSVLAAVLLPSAAFGAGPAHVGGSLPYNGDGAGGFTIDSAGFDRNDVTSAPCPIGATCVDMLATSSEDNFLVREVTVPTFGYRFIQLIFAESDPVDGDFIYEAAVTPEPHAVLGDSVEDNIGSKQIIDVADTGSGAFFASHEFYRGFEMFENGNTGPSMVMVQIVGDFQTTTFDGLIPETLTSLNYRIGIVQDGADDMANFAHVATRGSYSPTPGGVLEIGDQSLEIGPLRDALSATWIGAQMSGGGPGVTAEQRDFGLLIYRNFRSAAPTLGGEPIDGEIRGFSLQSDHNDSGFMNNPAHGTFVGGADLLSNFWDDTIFGPIPFE